MAEINIGDTAWVPEATARDTYKIVTYRWEDEAMKNFLAYSLFGSAFLTTGLALAGGGTAPVAGAPAAGLPILPADAAMPAGGLAVNLASTTPPKYKNVVYATASSSEKLDIYLPSGTGPFPVIFMVHGGGFKFGDQAGWRASVGKALLKAGYALVGVGYRLSGEATFPAAPQDVKAAVRFVRANAAKYNLDPNRFAAYGESAGGNLAAMLGTTGNQATVFDAPSLGNAGVSSAVRAVADLYGPNDFAAIDSFLTAEGCAASEINHNTSVGFESIYLGAALPKVAAKVKQANPITYVDAGDAPFLIENGGKDCNVGFGQGQLLQNALNKAGVANTKVAFPNAAHGGVDFETASNAQRIVTFFNTYVK